MQTTVIDLIRHGEPVGGIRYRGTLDDELSKKGWEQMFKAVNDYSDWDIVVTSPLRRCHAFAKIITERNNLPLKVNKRFREIGFGCWEGRTADEITRLYPDSLSRFYKNPIEFRPPGAESMLDFEQRVTSAWKQMILKYAGKRILLVSHGGVIRVIIAHILEMSLSNLFKINIGNACISRIQYSADHDNLYPQLLFVGGTLLNSNRQTAPG